MEKENKETPKIQTVKVKKKKNRCYCCKKKVGMLGITCKCGKLFCTSHMHPESHECSFNHKEFKKEQLTNNLIKLEADKIIRI